MVRTKLKPGQLILASFKLKGEKKSKLRIVKLISKYKQKRRINSFGLNSYKAGFDIECDNQEFFLESRFVRSIINEEFIEAEIARITEIQDMWAKYKKQELSKIK